MKLIKNKTYWLFLLPSLLGVVLFQLLPMAFTIFYSFWDMGSSSFVILENYMSLLKNNLTIVAFINLLKTISLGLFPLLIISFFLGYSFYNTKNNYNIGVFLSLIPFFIPNASVAFYWKYLFSSNGLINIILAYSGLNPMEWIYSKMVFGIMSLLYIWRYIGAFTLLWYSGFKSVENQQIESAQSMGATSCQIVFCIMLPNMYHCIFMLLCLSVISIFDIYRDMFFLIGEFPSEHIYLFQHLFSTMFQNMQYGEMSAAATLVSLFLFIVMLLGYRVLRIGCND